MQPSATNAAQDDRIRVNPHIAARSAPLMPIAALLILDAL
jgi:hypothetical protein